MDKNLRMLFDAENNVIDFVDKNVDIVAKTPKKYGVEEEFLRTAKGQKKQKILKVNIDEAFMEGNLIEMPFISYNIKKKDIVTVVEYNWIDSKGICRGIEVRGSGRYGVPTASEFDVLVAILRISAKKNKLFYNNVICEHEISKEDLVVEFTLTEIAEEMGHNRPNGVLLNRIKESIEILTDTTIYNRFSGGIYDVTNRDYIEDNAKAFHIIESFESYSVKKLSPTKKRLRPQDIKQKIVLNEFFYKSIASNYFIFFNYKLYKNISSNIGKKLFLILHKWRNNREQITIKTETLYQRIPLEDSIPIRQKNQSIKRALQALKKAGCILDFNISKGTIIIDYIPEKSMKKLKESNNGKQMEDYKTLGDIILKLDLYGIHDVSSYIDFIVAEIDYTKALLRYIDLNKEKIYNIDGYIRKGLSEKYILDSNFYIEYESEDLE